MVDITGKSPTRRSAVAEARVELGAEIFAKLQGRELHGPKGPVFQTAIIAGTMAVKKTADLIPFCHPLPVENCEFRIEPGAADCIIIRCEVTTSGKTGVEMEAMTGASVAALTVYDMCKAMHKGICIRELRLISKTGGKSGDYHASAPARPLRGLLLAGGRSSRMGRDKASMPHPDGRSLARRAYELLRECGCDGVAISLRHDQEIPAGFEGSDGLEIIRDPAGASQGPLTGILAAMHAHPAADCLVLACDLPRLDRASLVHLIASKRREDRFLAYQSDFDGLPEPLCALYTPSALPVLEEALQNDFRCPRKILIQQNCRLLVPLVPHALDNANTPEDWENALRS
jgi:cyclic pyranopterin phosphate synthase